MIPSSNFEITRRNPAGNASAILNVAALRGLALTQDDKNSEAFIPAGPTSFIGHLTRDVTVAGLTLADRMFGRTTPTPTGLAGPFTVGDQVTVEKAHELEAEDPLLLLSGTRSISKLTPVPSPLTFESGLLAVALSGDQVYYTLTANGLQTSDPANTNRIRAEHI